jgi:DNA-sulfur modification-associated
MKEAHEQTQSDFKGGKSKNKLDFREYLQESVNGMRIPYLPVVSGWQTQAAMAKTVFVAFDEDDADALYGLLYLPKLPIMQADGQTQTAALFALAVSKDATVKGALEKFRVTLEIELNVDERQAGQSFADRNGRGSKKNKNLVIALDTSSALSDLREKSIQGTVFEKRLANGRNTQTTETATTAIVDLSTMEQMLLNVISDGRYKAEEIKHHHIEHLVPYTRDFLRMLDDAFSKDWVEKTRPNEDPFRKIYVHGWPFALKAIASAYYRARIDELGPLSAALSARDGSKTVEEALQDKLADERTGWTQKPAISLDELTSRLGQIDWLRYRQHWVALTGAKMKDGKKRTFKLKSTGEEKILGQAQNTPYIISSVRDKILSDSWTDLTRTDDEIVETPGAATPPRGRKRGTSSDRSRAIAETAESVANTAILGSVVDHLATSSPEPAGVASGPTT